MQELIEIQNQLKVPKSLFSEYGNYYYRNQEDILEALKPILQTFGLYMTLSDKVENIGAKNYVVATATLFGNDGNSISCVGYAAEDNEKKKFSNSQLTGSASSYARKYALNGLFLLDDQKDDDNDEGETGEHISFDKFNPPTKEQLLKIDQMIKHYKPSKKWEVIDKLEAMKRADKEYIQTQIDNFDKAIQGNG